MPVWRHVTGTATTTGQTSISMDLHENEAMFTLHFKGTTVTKTVATRRPVDVYTTGVANFEARRIIRFDGVRFTAQEPTIDATYSSTTDDVETPRGIIGRIARRKAYQRIDEIQGESDALALADVKTMIMSSYDRETEQFVTRINGVVPIEKTVLLFFPTVKGWVNHVASTTNSIIVSPGPKEAVIPTLPKEYVRMRAPVELWVQGKEEGESKRRALEMWTTVQNGLDQFRAKQSGKEAKVEGLKFTAVGDWWVIKVGDDLAGEWLDKMEKIDPKK